MNYPRTLKALAIVDAHAARTDKLLDDAETDAEVGFWSHVEHMRNDYVRQAFLADTADRNCWSQVRCASVDDIRRMVGE